MGKLPIGVTRACRVQKISKLWVYPVGNLLLYLKKLAYTIYETFWKKGFGNISDFLIYKLNNKFKDGL